MTIEKILPNSTYRTPQAKVVDKIHNAVRKVGGRVLATEFLFHNGQACTKWRICLPDGAKIKVSI